MYLKRKVLALLLSVTIIITIFMGCSDSSKPKKDVKEIGILQLIQHDALDAANKGFVEGLKEKGYVDGKNIKIEQQNAQGKIDVSNQIASTFVSEDKDLIYTISTSSTQAVLNATKSIPVVFSAVTSPVKDGIVKSLESSGNNATGTSDKVNIEEQLELFKKLMPNAHILGVIYTTSETNSVNQVNELKLLAKKFDLEIKEIGIANINEINQNLTNAISKIDALYVPTDNNVAASYDLVGKIAINNNVAAIGAEPAIVEKGGLFSKGIDYYTLGKMAGYKAAKILDGKNPSDIPIETMEELKITINKDVVEKLNITVPSDIKEKAKFVTGGVHA